LRVLERPAAFAANACVPKTLPVLIYRSNRGARLLMALFGRGAMSDLGPLSGAKQKTSARIELFRF
jgi:hypothetical protein